MKRAVYHGSIESVTDFLSHLYSSIGLKVLIHWLIQRGSVQIPLFKGDHTKNNNKWGLSLLRNEKQIYIYIFVQLPFSPAIVSELTAKLKNTRRVNSFQRWYWINLMASKLVSTG